MLMVCKSMEIKLLYAYWNESGIFYLLKAEDRFF